MDADARGPGGAAAPARARVVDLLVACGLAMRRRGDEGRARAYLRAANEVARRDDFEALLAAGKLQDIRGVGRSIAGTIERFALHGEGPTWLGDGEADLAAATEALAVPPGWAEAPFAGVPDLHTHTTWSDGALTLDELAALAERLGHVALGVSDHSGSLRIARGLDPAAQRAQWADVARVQRAHPGLRILRGTECDILRDGSLDHPPEILAGFDYVIGSLHSHLRALKEEQTARVLAALDQPALTILGHPTTRVPGRRPPANLDLDAIFAKAAERGVALEVNGNPGRLDLDADLARRALAAGCKLSLGSDAHHGSELPGLATARRIAAEAGAGEGDVVNAAVARRPAQRPQAA